MQVIDWQIIIEKHGPVVWQTAYRLLGNSTDAADCFQETFVSALELSQRQHIRNFSSLLVRLATTRAIDQLRLRFRQSKSCVSAELADVTSKNPDPAKLAQQSELVDRLRTELTQLPQQDAQVFCMRYLNDMSYRQIAKALGININAAGVLLHRARAKLRKSLELSPNK
jgi:RNA polymerase sigma-70 factor (ECF subfamily)